MDPFGERNAQNRTHHRRDANSDRHLFRRNLLHSRSECLGRRQSCTSCNLLPRIDQSVNGSAIRPASHRTSLSLSIHYSLVRRAGACKTEFS